MRRFYRGNNQQRPPPVDYNQFMSADLSGDPDRIRAANAQHLMSLGEYHRGGGLNRVAPSRRGYQRTRVESHREVRSDQTGVLYRQAVDRMLVPGLKEGDAASRMEAVNMLRAITLTITTRSIGLGITHIFYKLFEFERVPLRGTIYQMYRSCLAVMEVKVIIANSAVTCVADHQDAYAPMRMTSDMIRTAKSILRVPDQIYTPVETIGIVKQFDMMNVPRLGRDNYTRGNNPTFIP